SVDEDGDSLLSSHVSGEYPTALADGVRPAIPLSPRSGCSRGTGSPSGTDHGMPQQQIGPCLISLAVRLQPFDNIRIQTHGYRLLRRTVKLADLGSAPIDDCGDIGKINVLVFLSGAGGDVSLLFSCELPHSFSSRCQYYCMYTMNLSSLNASRAV